MTISLKNAALTAAASTLLLMSGNEAQSSSSGTGFLINQHGHIITNNHVVRDKLQLKSGRSIDIPCRRLTIRSRGVRAIARIVARDPKNDLAVIKVKPEAFNQQPFMHVAATDNRIQTSGGWKNIGGLLSPDSGPQRITPNSQNSNFIKFAAKPVQPGTKISVLGYPLGYISTPLKITSGIVVATAGFRNNTSALQIDAAVNPGNSGGPILNKAGHLVGVISSRVSIILGGWAGIDVAQGFNFGVKSAVTKTFLDVHGVPYHLGRNDQNIEAKDLYKNSLKSVVTIICRSY